MTDTDVLWGGVLAELSVDVTRRAVSAVVRTTSGDVATEYEVHLEGVSELRVERPESPSWDYTEVTECRAVPALGQDTFEAIFWAEPNGLPSAVVGCAR